MRQQQVNVVLMLSSTVTLIITLLFSVNIYADKNSIILTSEQIEQMRTTSMIDLLNQIPGVKASATTVGFNGFNTKEILVLLDGRAINDPTSAWRAVNWSTILVANIARLEIIKGSTGGRYGSHSGAGVVKMTTKKTDGDLQGNLHATVGSVNYKNLSLAARKRMGHYGVNFTTRWNASDGLRANSKRSNYKVGLRLKNYHPNIVPLLLSFDYNKTDRQSPGSVHRLTPEAFSVRENIGTSLILPFTAVKSETHFNLFKRSYTNPATSFTRELQERQLKQKLFGSATIAGLGEFSVGIDGILQDISGLNLTRRSETSLGLYLGKAMTFANVLNTTTDLTAKLDIKSNFYSKFPSTVNKGISLHLPLKNSNLTFSLASFNTLPSATRRYSSSTTLVANPDLKMEEGINYNLSMSANITESLDLSGSLFYNQASNLIKFTREGSIGTFENIGSSTTKGLQVDIKYQLNRMMQTSFSYTLLNALDDKTGNFLTHSPEHEFSLNLEYKPIKSLLISSKTTYKSARYYNSSNTGKISGRYFRTNIRVNNSFSQAGSIYLKIDNIFDAQFHGMAGHPVNPISMYAGVKYAY